jgi:hypothetical protein
MVTMLMFWTTGFDSRQGRFCPLVTTSGPTLGLEQPQVITSEVKQLVREADHSVSSDVEVKNVLRYTFSWSGV